MTFNRYLKHILIFIAFLIYGIICACSVIPDTGDNSSSSSSSSISGGDTESPVINTFSGPAEAVTSAVFPVIFEAIDNVGVTGWMISYTNIKPSGNDSSWMFTKPTNFTLCASGTYTLYAWAKDNAGNIGSCKSITVTFNSSDTEAPVISQFSGPSTTKTAFLKGLVLNGADDGTGSTGIKTWIITESAVKPLPSDSKWQLTKPTIWNISGVLGTHTLYAYAKDEAGNISGGVSLSVNFIKAKWTILLHFAVDNNIDYEFEKKSGILNNYINTLENVKKSDSSDDVQIVLMLDAYNHDPSGVNYTSRFRDGYYYLTGDTFTNDLVREFYEINSGSVEDSKLFIDWALSNCPADHYMYSIFNHGSGFNDENSGGTYGSTSKGIGFDDSANDCLSHYELGILTSYIKSKTGKKIDLFYPYACLMGGVELAYELRNNADYILFSEQIFPADRWSYEALGTLTENPGISGLQLAKNFCVSASNYFSSLASFTLSVADLSQMDLLYNSINDYSLEALSFINNDRTKASYFIYAATNSFRMDYPYYVDLGDFLNQVTNNPDISEAVKSKARTVLSGIKTAVKYNTAPWYIDLYGNMRASGLSILHNIWVNRPYSTGLYRSILAFGANKWTDYITMIDSLNNNTGDAYEPDDDYAHSKAIILNGDRQYHSFHYIEDVDYIKLDLRNVSPGTGIVIETYPWTKDADTCLNFGFSNDFYRYNDDKGADRYSKIVAVVDIPDIYYIDVCPYYGSHTGDYSIDVKTTNLSGADAYEPDNIPATAKQITVNGGSQSRSLHFNGDRDWMYFNAQKDNMYVISLDEGSISECFLLYESKDTKNSINNGQNGMPIYFYCTNSGKYYIFMPESSYSSGNYSISVKTTNLGQPDAYEPDDNLSQAKEIIPGGGAQFRNLNITVDRDWICFNPQEESNYIITLNSASNFLTGIIYSSEKFPLGYILSKEANIGLLSPFILTNANKETYYICVSGNGNTGDYSLEIKTTNLNLSFPKRDAYEPDFTTYKSITPDGGIQQRSLHMSSDMDLASFYAIAGSNYIITFNSASNILDAFVFTNTEFTEGIYGNYETPVYFPCTKSGTYGMRITSRLQSVGYYTLEVKTDKTGRYFPGAAWIDPQNKSVANGNPVTIEVHVNCGMSILAGYDMTLQFNTAILGNPDVTAGPDGFVSSWSRPTPGTINIKGSDLVGKGPGSDLVGKGPGSNLAVLKITFLAIGTGTSTLNLKLNSLVDPHSNPIGTLTNIGGAISVN